MKRRLRQQRASRWTGNPKGRSRQKLGAQKGIHSRLTENLKGRSRHKLGIFKKKQKQKKHDC